MTLYANTVFAPIDRDLHLERIAGGNETEVYATDDHRFVVKLKMDMPGGRAEALAIARSMRDAAHRFAECLGPEHTIHSHYLLADDSDGVTHVLVLQPYIKPARSLAALDYATLGPDERARLAANLRAIIARSLAYYRSTGQMPDLYGRSSANHAERARENAPDRLPARLWSFLVRRNLLRSHNLLLTDEPTRRVLLVDYDVVRRGWLYRTLYFATRAMLFLRDLAWIAWMERGGRIPKA